MEIDALINLCRYPEAELAATRALHQRRGIDPDHAVRLRIDRAQALWLQGRFSPAHHEAVKAAALARAPLSQGRAVELLGMLAWKERGPKQALGLLARARETYEARRHAGGIVRVLDKQGAVLREAGRVQEALAAQTMRVELASRLPRLDSVAQARSDRGALLTALGRWEEARAEIDLAGCLFRQLQDVREMTQAAVQRAAGDLAHGELARARATLERVRQGEGGGDRRVLGEALLWLSDVCLALGAADEAERASVEAGALFATLHDRAGESWSKVRRSQALLAIGRVGEAASEARRAIESVTEDRAHLYAWSMLAYGRTMLRCRRTEAGPLFERAMAHCAERPEMIQAARLGRLLAGGAADSQVEVSDCLAALEAFGHRHLLWICVRDVGELGGRLAGSSGQLPGRRQNPLRLVESQGEARRTGTEESCAVRFPQIIGECPAMHELFGKMARVAASDICVHVFGETGTGKERVAEALHCSSSRRSGPFVPINASALNDELFESEMFGHAKGAFTGAIAERDGFVAQAEGGTLFIDEIADLSPRNQARLLRLLQSKEYRRLGENALRRANIRVISAANVDLMELAAKKLFREDLLYRLQVVVLKLPPLRERDGDIVRLARHFLRHRAAREGRRAPELEPEVLRAFERYSWPGNVRELENEIFRLVVLAGDGAVTKAQLSGRIVAETPRPAVPLRDARWDFERRHIAQALGLNGGNRVRTAAMLGITRQGLLAKIRQMGLS